MDTKRILILGGALAAAMLAALLARGMIGAGNDAAATPAVEMTEIVVAAKAIEVGHSVMPGDLKWQGWPKSAVDATFITKETQPQALEDATKGTVARMALVSGEPVTGQKVIKTDGAGFMAAVLTPGKRAIGVKLSAEHGAGGFILPNDRVDVIMTRRMGNDEGGNPTYKAATVLRAVRVLAVDQTSQGEGDAKTIVGKTATLELSSPQAEKLVLAEAMGELSLSLRALSQSDKPIDDDAANKGDSTDDDQRVTILRHGIPSHTALSAKE